VVLVDLQLTAVVLEEQEVAQMQLLELLELLTQAVAVAVVVLEISPTQLVVMADRALPF
jgi:hypothetical protein